MNPILQFICDRRTGARDLKKSTEFGVHLLTLGHESDAVLRLAALTDVEWHLEEQLVEQALRDSGQAALLEDQTFFRAAEAELIAAYFAGEIRGQDLISTVYNLSWTFSDQDDDFWLVLAEESTLYGDNGISPLFHFDRLPFDEALRRALDHHRQRNHRAE
jgi:hypothetical protein